MNIKKQATSQTKSPPSPILAHYEALVEIGAIQDDKAQREVIKLLEKTLAHLPAPRSAIGKLFKRDSAPSAQRNLYMWGSVGRGKSMLMDLFFEAVPFTNKRRVHFHAFMLEVHARLHTYRTHARRNKDGADPVLMLAKELTKEIQLLCFDEVQATDVADATLLYRLFEALFRSGVVIISTSNHPPISLYTGNIQQERFKKFIALIESNMKVVSLASPSDYRYLQLRSLQPVFFTPLGPKADAFIASTLENLGVLEAPKPDMFVIQGRSLPFMLYDNGIGRFNFAMLCAGALGASDYQAIAKRLQTVILTDIPKLSPEQRNEAKRFVTLIDCLYERKVKLICTSEVPPEKIYEDGDGSFEFARTVSRLTEMQSANYLQGKAAYG